MKELSNEDVRRLPIYEAGHEQGVSEVGRQQGFVVAFPDIARLPCASVSPLHPEKGIDFVGCPIDS